MISDIGYCCGMSKQPDASDLLRQRLRAERERRNLTQFALANLMAKQHNCPMYGYTIAKIESGQRPVLTHELVAFATIFQTSVDALVGRSAGVNDVLWAASKLSSNAHKMIGEVAGLQNRLSADLQDLAWYADREQKRDSVDTLLGSGGAAHLALHRAHESLAALAGEFPLPGRG
jgi:transcriptional regulator with XRE-family HTH domain